MQWKHQSLSLTRQLSRASLRAAASNDSDADDDTIEVDIVPSQEALQMIQSLWVFLFVKELFLNHVELLDALEKEISRLHAKQAKLTDYGFVVY
ncbi:hypothetical protein HPB47_018546 [Ixodes persulcatus]|uniref:Uncharacterized protein n=1 Tax=Ixodes persulcatus TaxID=34615 RepID=A0AC60QMR5_IXOPE|nr:hypothetical protein HPB47_018546 [Ixodes persulcatus]